MTNPLLDKLSNYKIEAQRRLAFLQKSQTEITRQVQIAQGVVNAAQHMYDVARESLKTP